MTGRHHGTLRMTATALLAAYILVLQALLGGLASGAHAASSFTVDEFGQVLCLSADHGVPADPAHHTPDCCTTGCPFAPAGAAPLPSAVALALPPAVSTTTLPPPTARSVQPAQPPGPHRARAPPRSV